MAAILVGLIGTAITAGITIYQGVDKKQKAKAATNQANALVAEAQKNLEKNPYEDLSVNLTASERSRDAMRGLSAQGGLGTFDQRMSPGQRALNSLMNQEQQIQGSEIKQQQDLEKLVAKEDAAIKDAQASINIGQAKQQRDAATQMEADSQAMFGQAAATTAAGVGTAIGQSARSQQPLNSSLRGLDRSASGVDAAGVKFDYGDASQMGQALYDASQNTGFDWTSNTPTDFYTSGMQQGFYNKLQANKGFQKEFDATFGGNNVVSQKQMQDFMARNFLPYEIQAMYK